jgi:glycosyltransferase involved in cell wall biosynthesis
MTRLALISPSENAYTTTFIQQHRNQLDGEIHYMYGGILPFYVDNGTKLIPDRFIKRYFMKIYGKIIQPRLNERERSIYRYLSQNNINVVLAEYGHIGASILNVCGYLKIPLIVHFHGHDAYRIDLLNRFHEKYLEMFIYATAIISVSKDMTDQLVSLGCPIDKILYNPYGPVEQFYSLSNTFEKKHFLAVGRFVDKKAPYLTLDAFRKTLLEHPDAHLIMVGDGPLLEVCKNLVESWDMERSVHFKGALEQKEIIKYFSKCIAFIQHSIVASSGDSEGTPVAILEAGAAGLPVISTRHAGIKDVVLDGETGYLVDELDTDTMSARMIKLASNPKLAAELGRAARDRIYNNYNLNSHISKINQIVENSVNPDRYIS